jgi:hypothetical protein
MAGSRVRAVGAGDQPSEHFRLSLNLDFVQYKTTCAGLWTGAKCALKRPHANRSTAGVGVLLGGAALSVGVFEQSEVRREHLLRLLRREPGVSGGDRHHRVRSVRGGVRDV